MLLARCIAIVVVFQLNLAQARAYTLIWIWIVTGIQASIRIYDLDRISGIHQMYTHGGD